MVRVPVPMSVAALRTSAVPSRLIEILAWQAGLNCPNVTPAIP
jgi:hypothetical protein